MASASRDENGGEALATPTEPLPQRRKCPFCFTFHHAKSGDDEVCPSPEEIATRAAEIRATWSPLRLATRSYPGACPWQVPEC